MDIKEALTFDGLKYFYTKYIKPLKTGAFSTVVNNATTTVANTVLDGRMGKTLADKDANLQSQINTLNSSLANKENLLYKGTLSGNDFNMAAFPGIYWINPTTTSYHHPYPGSWGMLEVLGNNLFQRFISYDSNGHSKTAIRSFTNGVWSEWSKQQNNNVRGIVAVSKTGVSVSTSITNVTVNYNVPEYPIAVIPIIHGGTPVYCSVNSWTQTSAQIMLCGSQSVSNRVLQLLVIY